MENEATASSADCFARTRHLQLPGLMAPPLVLRAVPPEFLRGRSSGSSAAAAMKDGHHSDLLSTGASDAGASVQVPAHFRGCQMLCAEHVLAARVLSAAQRPRKACHRPLLQYPLLHPPQRGMRCSNDGLGCPGTQCADGLVHGGAAGPGGAAEGRAQADLELVGTLASNSASFDSNNAVLVPIVLFWFQSSFAARHQLISATFSRG